MNQNLKMMQNKKEFFIRLKRLAKAFYLKIFRLNDSPQRIALGFGLGVFLGVLPGTGPAAAILCAWILRLNKAAAFLGGLLFNTWVNILTLALAFKIGSAIMGNNYSVNESVFLRELKDFHLKDLLKASFQEAALPLLIGYLVIAIILAITSYLLILLIIKIKNRGGLKNV